MKPSFLLAILLFFPAGVFSQYVVSGKVTDNNNEPVAFATVTLLGEADSSIVNYSMTNDDGIFKLEHKESGSYLLQVSCLGYTTETGSVVLSDNQPVAKNFTLHDNPIKLDDFVVLGHDPGVSFKKDTIRYNPKVFTDGSEKVFGDVLNKLPGIEVDPKGGVKAQGKQVENILLNGQDIFSGNTKTATKNLPANIADKVEVLNNYSEYSLLEGFQSHNKTVINVGMSSDKLGRISGELTVAGGYKDKYLGKGNIMQINSKLMTSFIGALNNTGEEVFSIEEYIRLQGGINELINNNSGATIELSKEEQELLMPRNNTFERRNGLGALNLAYQPCNTLKLTSYFLFNETKETAIDRIKYNYMLPENSLETAKQLDSKGTNILYSGLWKLNYQPSKTFNLAYKRTVSNIDMNKEVNSLNTFDKQRVNALDMYDARTTKTRHDVLLMKSIGAHLLAANLYASYSEKPGLYDMHADSLLLPIHFVAQNNLFHGQQRTYLEQVETGGTLSFMYKINSSYFINSSLNAKLHNQKYHSNIYQSNPSGTLETLTADSLHNKLSMRLADYNAGAGIVKNNGLLQFKLGAFAHLYQSGNNPIGFCNKAKLNPMAQISLHFSQKHLLNVSFSKTDSSITADTYPTGIVFNSYQSYRHNSQINNLFSTKQNVKLLYRIYDLFSNTMVVLTALHSHIENATTNNYNQQGLLTEYQPVSASPRNIFTTRLYMHKGLTFIPWTIKLNGGYNNTSLSNLSLGIENKVNIEGTNGQLRFESNYRKRLFNFECKAGLEHLKNKSSLGIENKQLIQRYGGLIKLNTNKHLIANAGLEYIVNDAPYYQQEQYILNFLISYLLNKHFDLELAGVNILNTDKQDWVATSYNGAYMTERYFRQIPGNVMLKVKYKF